MRMEREREIGGGWGGWCRDKKKQFVMQKKNKQGICSKNIFVLCGRNELVFLHQFFVVAVSDVKSGDRYRDRQRL